MNSPANAAQPSGANAPLGQNGCTYPTDVPTLFNQLNAAGKTWKGYAQDIGGAQTPGSTQFQAETVPNREDAVCAGPGTAGDNPDTSPTSMSANLPTGVTSLTAAQPNDQYVAKHFPFPWFQSLTGSTVTGPALNKPSNGGTNCDANHIANLDNPNTGLVHDLQKSSSDAELQLDHPEQLQRRARRGLQGQQPVRRVHQRAGRRTTQSPIPYDPESTTPKNYTGGLYASDLFLQYYIPLIEQSPAFKQGGLIDVTFDEAFPPFTYTGNSFNDANNYPPTSEDKPNYTSSITSDTAGENLFGRNVNDEPTGPNSTLGVNAKGDQLYPGPGNNAFIDRPPVCTQTSPALVPADCVPGIVRGGAGSPPAARTDTVTGTSGSIITDPSIVSDDTGRAVTGTNIPANSFVGAVTNTGPLFPATSSGAVTTGSFQLVGQDGSPVTPTGPVTAASRSAPRATRRTSRPGRPPTRCSTPPSRPPAAVTPAAS